MKENEMDGACSTNGTDQKFVETRKMKGRNKLQELNEHTQEVGLTSGPCTATFSEILFIN